MNRPNPYRAKHYQSHLLHQDQVNDLLFRAYIKGAIHATIWCTVIYLVSWNLPT